MTTVLVLVKLNLLALACLLAIYAVLWLVWGRRRRAVTSAAEAATAGPASDAGSSSLHRFYARRHDHVGNLYLSFIVYYVLAMVAQTAGFTDSGPHGIFVLIYCVPTLLLWILTFVLWRERGFHDVYPAAVLVAAHALFGVNLLSHDLSPILHQLGWPA